jgi:hypothetical protein
MKQATKSKKKKPRASVAKRNGHAPIATRPNKKRRPKDPLFTDFGTFTDSGPADLSENWEKYSTEISIEKYERSQRR